MRKRFLWKLVQHLLWRRELYQYSDATDKKLYLWLCRNLSMFERFLWKLVKYYMWWRKLP
jgi:hypothetical protein